MSESQSLSFKEKFGYGLGDCAANLFWMNFAFFLPYFYTDVFGLSAAAAATLLLATRIVDTVTDPAMGAIADRTKTRWGQFRPYILFGCVPFACFGVLTFYSPDLSTGWKLIYAYVTYTVTVLFYTFINIPYGALAGVMTSSSEERTKLQSYRFTGAFVGALIVQFSMLKLVDSLGQGDEKQGFLYATMILGLIAISMYLVTFFTTKERVKPKTEQISTSVWADLKLLFHNKPWVILSFVSLFVMTYTAVRSGITLYYFKYYFESSQHSLFGLFELNTPTLYMVTGRLALIAGVLLTPWLCRIFDKRSVFIGSLFFNGVLICTQYFVGPQDLMMILIIDVFIGFASGPTPVIMWAMFADTADYEECKSGRRITGLVFSASSFAIKMGFAIGGFIALQVLAMMGFVANEVQPDSVMQGIRGIFSYIPGLCSIVAAVMMFFYSLTQRKVNDVELELHGQTKNT